MLWEKWENSLIEVISQLRILADILYLLIYYVVRYRRKVTRDNLSRSYPDMTDVERRALTRRYYHHISDLLVEAVWNLFASPKYLLRHYRFVNREVVNRYYEEGRSVVLMSSHYNNWEYMITTINLQLRHHAVGVGKPLQDHGARFITRRRGRFGTQIVDHTDVRQTMAFYDRYKVPVAYMMLSDQSPSNIHKSFWTMFMHQETPFLYGAEYFARKYNMPVLYYDVTKVRRGYYEVRFSLLCENTVAVPQYTITSRYISLLEKTIETHPEYWLWSHKRWKRHRTPDIPLYDYHKLAS